MSPDMGGRTQATRLARVPWRTTRWQETYGGTTWLNLRQYYGEWEKGEMPFFYADRNRRRAG